MKRACLITLLTSMTGAVLFGQTPTIFGVASVANSPQIAPGGFASIFGSNLSAGNLTHTAPNTTTVVTVGGKKGYVYYESPDLLNIQIPVDAPVNTATPLVVGSSAPFLVTLSTYAPALYANSPSTTVLALHSDSRPVSSTSPAVPNEVIIMYATGLGPTNPPAVTGVAPTGAPQTTTLPTVTLAGLPCKVQFSGLFDIGFYQINFTVPANTPPGYQNISISIGGATSNVLTLPVSIPVISSIGNAASYIPAGLPNSGIAQGAIFVVKGSNLGPTTLSIASSGVFQSTGQAGTSVDVIIKGQTSHALMYYSSAGQVAALLPSNTPLGTGTATVTYNSVTGATFPVTVVQNNLGIFTASSDGAGAGIVTYPDYSLVSVAKAANCGGLYTACGAANPGDVLTLWATGLGPVNGSDAAGAGLGQNMTGVPLKLWLGGVQAQVSYQGRTGCCIGEDQINFMVPNSAPTGCAVPLIVQINDQISNSTVIPVANGSRSCTPTNPTFTPSVVASLSAGAQVTYGSLNFRRQFNSSANGFVDTAKAQFGKVTVGAAIQPFIVSYLDTEPLGTCAIYNNFNTGSNPPFASLVGIDAGPKLSVTGPNGSQSIPLNAGQSPTEYDATLSAAGTYFSPGSYTASGTGGADIGAFTAPFTILTQPVWTNQSSLGAVSRTNGLTVNWSGGSPNTVVLIEGQSATDKTLTNGSSFSCAADGSLGTFTVPPFVTLALNPGSNAALYFKPTIYPVSFAASGLGLGFLNANLLQAIVTTFH